MAQRVGSVEVSVDDGFFRLAIRGAEGGLVEYTAEDENSLAQVFSDLPNTLRHDMDYEGMVPAGTVLCDYSDTMEDWPDITYLLDDCYLGETPEYIEEWVEGLSEIIEPKPVGYTSEVSIGFDEDYRDIIITLGWMASQETDWDTSEGAAEYHSRDYSAVEDMIADIANTWASDFTASGIEYSENMDFEYDAVEGLVFDRTETLEAFRDLWDGHDNSQAVQDLIGLLYSLYPPEGYFDTSAIDYDPDERDIIIYFGWHATPGSTLDSDEGGIEYHSRDYSTVKLMIVEIANHWAADFGDLGIGFFEDMDFECGIDEGPQFDRADTVDAFRDLWEGQSNTNSVDDLVERLEECLEPPEPSMILDEIELKFEPIDCAVSMRLSFAENPDAGWNSPSPQDLDSLKYLSTDYSSLDDMMKQLARELPVFFSENSIGISESYPPEVVDDFSDGIIDPDHVIDAFEYLVVYGSDMNSEVMQFSDDLQEAIDVLRTTPRLTSIRFTIGSWGGDITITAENGFWHEFPIDGPEEVASNFAAIAQDFNDVCLDAEVEFDDENPPEIESGGNVDIFDKYSEEDVEAIFFDLYNGIFSNAAKGMASWISSEMWD